MQDPFIELLADTLVVCILGKWVLNMVEMDKESFQFFQRHAKELETIFQEDAMRENLPITDDWAEEVGRAIGESPYLTKIFVLSLWEKGWSVPQILHKLTEKANEKGVRLFFVDQLEPHERS